MNLLVSTDSAKFRLYPAGLNTYIARSRTYETMRVFLPKTPTIGAVMEMIILGGSKGGQIKLTTAPVEAITEIR
jgi:hypothetical protein